MTSSYRNAFTGSSTLLSNLLLVKHILIPRSIHFLVCNINELRIGLGMRVGLFNGATSSVVNVIIIIYDGENAMYGCASKSQ